jgi:UDPglucose 6-dehydrogenase/UDP-N-acetyl-D-galactosamine dehydrogenase
MLTKEEIEAFGVKALDNPDVKLDCVIVAVAHDKFKNKNFLKEKAFMERDISSFSPAFLFSEKLVNEKLVLIDVRGIFDEKMAEDKGFYYRRL